MTRHPLGPHLGRGANTNPKVTLMRRALTTATDRYGIGGQLKQRGVPKPITLPRIKLQERP